MSKTLEEIVAATRDMTEGHAAFIKKEATAIEKEVSLAVKKHLIDRFKGYILYVPNAFPRLLKDPMDDSWLTDLDGATSSQMIQMPMISTRRSLTQESGRSVMPSPSKCVKCQKL